MKNQRIRISVKLKHLDFDVKNSCSQICLILFFKLLFLQLHYVNIKSTSHLLFMNKDIFLLFLLTLKNIYFNTYIIHYLYLVIYIKHKILIFNFHSLTSHSCFRDFEIIRFQFGREIQNASY